MEVNQPMSSFTAKLMAFVFVKKVKDQRHSIKVVSISYAY